MDNLFIKIKEIAKENPEGFTVDLELNPVPKVGFSVAIPQTQFSFKDEDLKNVIRIAKKLNCCIGGWLNQNDGNYYYDACIVVADKKEAVKLAKEFNQLAIYDLKNGVEIWT